MGIGHKFNFLRRKASTVQYEQFRRRTNTERFRPLFVVTFKHGLSWFSWVLTFLSFLSDQTTGTMSYWYVLLISETQMTPQGLDVDYLNYPRWGAQVLIRQCPPRRDDTGSRVRPRPSQQGCNTPPCSQTKRCSTPWSCTYAHKGNVSYLFSKW